MLRRMFLLSLLVALVSVAALPGLAFASVTLNLSKVEVTYTPQKPNGSTQTVFLTGSLHLDSHVTLDANGKATDFHLHANLSDASVSSDLAGDKKDCKPKPVCCAVVLCNAVGAVEQDFMPTSPVSPDALEVTWPLEFRVTGPGHDGSENGIIAILIGLKYDGSGNVTSAEVVSDTRSGGGCLTPCLVQ